MALASVRSKSVTVEEALELIVRDAAPDGLRVRGGTLTLTGKDLVRLPRGLRVRSLRLLRCPNLEALPKGLDVRNLEIDDCPRLVALPADLRCYEVRARRSALERLPADLRVEFRLDLAESARLTELPAGLKVGTLVLRGCTALERLPEGLDVCFLDLEGCRRLRGWPGRLTVRCGYLNLADCAGLTCLPPGLRRVAQLDLRGCAGIKDLPERLEVLSWVDVAGTGLTGLPPRLRDVPLRWRGVAVTERVAFRPETLTAREVLQEPNTEVRRVMIERVGFEWLVKHADAVTLDTDRDPGGERRLLRVPLPGDEDLVLLSVLCPSTGRQYVLRVPPATRTCRQAAAWIAGFNDPKDYRPRIET